MTLPANPRRDRYVANDGQTVFPYTFRIFAASDLVVERLRGTTTTTLQLNVDYTVSGVGNNTGGNVTLTQGALAGDIIAIVSNQPNQRSTDFTESGDFRAAALNAEFDRIWIAIQQIAQNVSRQITRPLSDPIASYVLPPTTVRANKYLGFGNDGSLAFLEKQPLGPNAAEAYWWGGTAGGTANALTISVAGAPSAYAAGQRYAFVAPLANTGAATLAVNSLGAKSILRPEGSTLAAGDIEAGTLVGVTYDGANFRLINSPAATTFNQNLTIAKANPLLVFNKPASGTAAGLYGQTNGQNRWAVFLGDAGAESGGDSGSHFVVRRFKDDGSVDTSFWINRENAAATFAGEVKITRPRAFVTLNSTTVTETPTIVGQKNGSKRWEIGLGDSATESSGNVGSNFIIGRYSNTGSWIGTAMVINRSDAAVTLYGPLTLPASDPTNANHAVRKAYVDAHDIWNKIADVAVSDSQMIDINGFSLADYHLIEINLLHLLPNANSSSDIVLQVFRNGSLVSSGYSHIRLVSSTAGTSTVGASNQSQFQFTHSGIRTEQMVSYITISQTASNETIILKTETFQQENVSNILQGPRAFCRVTGGAGWVDAIRITSPVAFTANVGRIVVMGLKK